MQNVECKLVDTKLIITVDLTKSFGPSKSGKSITIASTQGNVSAATTPKGEAVMIGLNVYRKA